MLALGDPAAGKRLQACPPTLGGRPSLTHIARTTSCRAATSGGQNYDCIGSCGDDGLELAGATAAAEAEGVGPPTAVDEATADGVDHQAAAEPPLAPLGLPAAAPVLQDVKIEISSDEEEVPMPLVAVPAALGAMRAQAAEAFQAAAKQARGHSHAGDAAPPAGGNLQGAAAPAAAAALPVDAGAGENPQGAVASAASSAPAANASAAAQAAAAAAAVLPAAGEQAPAGEASTEEAPVRLVMINEHGEVSLSEDAVKSLDKQEQTAWVNANTSTHKADWMVFLRQCTPKKKKDMEMPKEMAKEFLSGKMELFRVWFNSKRDWGQVNGHYKKKRIRELRAKMKFGFRTIDQMTEMYGGGERGSARALKVAAEKVARGLWRWHFDHPGDVEMRLHWVWLEQDLTAIDADIQELQLALQAEFDPDTAGALMGDGGLFDQSQPGIQGLSATGSAHAIADMGGSATLHGQHLQEQAEKEKREQERKEKEEKEKEEKEEKEKNKRVDKKKRAQPDKPIDIAKKFQLHLQKESAKAKHLLQNMQGRKFPKETYDELQNMQTAIDAEYAKIQQLVIDEEEEAIKYLALIEHAQTVVESFQEPFDVAKGGYDSMMKGKRKRMAGADEDEDDDEDDEGQES